MTLVGIETIIPTREGPQNHALDLAAIDTAREYTMKL
jgi:hypothetical protein